MSNYTIIRNQGGYSIMDKATGLFFNGYDFMGSVNWSDEEPTMEIEEARSIIADLDAADEPQEDPATKKYLLKTVCEDIKEASIKTGKQIAEIYNTDQICGIFASMEVWDLDTMKRISLLDLVEPILENQRWMEQEYRDYCDEQRYGD